MAKTADQFATIGHYTQRRFSNDSDIKCRIDFSTLTLGQTRKPRKKDYLPPISYSKTLPPEHFHHRPSSQRQRKNSTSLQWQRQQEIIAQRLLQHKNQQRNDRLQIHIPYKKCLQNTPSLMRAMSHSILTEAMKSKLGADGDRFSSDSITNVDEAVIRTKDRRNIKRSGSDWNLSKCISDMAEYQPNSSTLPNFHRNKFKSEPNLIDYKFHELPPALPPRNDPFKNSYVREVEVQKQKSGEFGIAIDCTRIKANILGIVSCNVHNFPIVRAIDPRGPTSKTNIKKGDYLLKVNDITTEGINYSFLEAVIKNTKQRLRLVVASLPPANLSQSSTPLLKIKDKMIMDKTLPPSNPAPLQERKFHTLDRVAGRQTNNRIYEVIDDVFNSEPSDQPSVSSERQKNYLNNRTEEKIKSNAIAEVIIEGQKFNQQQHVKNKNSLSENSSGFGSEENSLENSSGSSLGIPNGEEKIGTSEQPCLHRDMTKGSSTIYSNKDEAPSPLPPKKCNLYKTPFKASCVYQNEELKYSKPTKFQAGGRSLNPEVNIVSVSINSSKADQQFNQPPIVKPKPKIISDDDDNVFVDELTNTGMRIIFPKTAQTRRFMEDPGVRRDTKIQNLTVKEELNKIRTFKSLSEVDELIPYFVAPPEDFADPGNKLPPISQTLSVVTANKNFLKTSNFNTNIKKLYPPPTSKVTCSGKKITEKAITSDVNLWTCEEVETWLKSIGLEVSMVSSFAARGVDGKTLLTLKRADLIALGLKGLEERRDFERALVKVRLRNLLTEGQRC